MRVQAGQQDMESRPDRQTATETDQGSGLSLGDILQMIARHIWFILACLLVSTAITLVYIKRATPIYEATASIRIDPTRTQSLGLNELFTNGYADDLVPSEIAIIRSDTVAIATLNSLSDEEFQRFTGIPRSKIGIPQGATSLTPAQEGLLGMVKGSLGAAPQTGTQLVNISFRSPDPQMAALMANHVIAAYRHEGFLSRYDSVGEVTKYLSEAMSDLKTRAENAQKRLSEFQEKNTILPTGTSATGVSSNTTTERLGMLNARLTTAQADKIVKEAQMRAALSGDPKVLSSLYPSADLTALQTQQTTLYTQYTAMAAKFGPNWPPLGDLKKQLDDIDTRLHGSMDTVRSRLKEEYDTAAATEAVLQQEYNDQTEKAYALNRQQAAYGVLLAEGASSRQLYDTIQLKLQQAGISAGLSSVNTMLVDSARAPLSPIEPKKTAIMTFGVALGLFAGVGSAFLKEATSDKVQSVEQIERTLGYHLLATIPHLAGEKGGKASAAPVTSGPPSTLASYLDPLSRDAEAYRTLRNSVLLSSIDRPPKTVLVTSTIPGEGKSNTVSNYAVVLAQKGARVLAVDADLRRPTLHLRFGVENGEGLSNVILGETASDPFLNPLPELNNLFLLTAGKKLPLPSEALGSTRFHSLLERWESEFDYIIIDSAPLLIVSDSLPLASWVDALILVTRYNMTPLGALKRVRDVLNRTNAHVAGLIINDIAGSGAGYYGGYGYDYYK